MAIIRNRYAIKTPSDLSFLAANEMRVCANESVGEIPHHIVWMVHFGSQVNEQTACKMKKKTGTHPDGYNQPSRYQRAVSRTYNSEHLIGNTRSMVSIVLIIKIV